MRFRLLDTPLGSGDGPDAVVDESVLWPRRSDDCDAASICRLVCWCMVREYEPRSAGGGGETDPKGFGEYVSWLAGMFADV